MTAEEILAKAADLVERPGGWCQSTYAKGRAVCLLGAISVADGAKLSDLGIAEHVLSPSGDMAILAVAQETDSLGCAVDRWNDLRGRTAIEVSTALRNAKRFL